MVWRILNAHVMGGVFLFVFLCGICLVLGVDDADGQIPFVMFSGALALALMVVALPVTLMSHLLLCWQGYTSLPTYMAGALIAGLGFGILSGYGVVETAPEWNGYQEIYGWERAWLFIVHYMQSVFVALVFGVTYWLMAVKKR